MASGTADNWLALDFGLVVMAIDFNHPFVGRAVVYRAWHPGAAPEQGIVTSVNEDAGLVFVRFGSSIWPQATNADDRLTFIDGSPVRIGAAA